MLVKALKSGKFAHPEPSKGFIRIKKKEIYDVDDQMAASMLACGWADPTIEKQFNKMTKSELIAFAEDNSIPIDKTLTNAKMVEALQDVSYG